MTKLTDDHLTALRIAQIGRCNCLTKTPDPKFHSAKCPYRLITEVIQVLESNEARGLFANTLTVLVSDAERWRKALSFAKGIIERLDRTDVMKSSVSGLAYDAAERAVFIRNLANEALSGTKQTSIIDDKLLTEANAWITELRRAHVYLDEGKPFFSGKDCAEIADVIERLIQGK